MATSQKILVTGAYGGIGSELARRLRSAGADLHLVGRDSDRLAALANDLGVTWSVAATGADDLSAAVDVAVERMGGLDGAVHCFGSILLKPAHRTTPEEWQDVLDANLTSAFHLLRAATPQLRQDGGSIVLVSSAAARLGLANHEAVAAAKAGVIGLTLSAAASYAPWGVRVNCVAPGLVDTPLAKRITSNKASLKASESMHALGRIGRPEEVASAIAWLLDREQSWVTGQVIGVDGGLGTLVSRG